MTAVIQLSMVMALISVIMTLMTQFVVDRSHIVIVRRLIYENGSREIDIYNTIGDEEGL